MPRPRAVSWAVCPLPGSSSASPRVEPALAVSTHPELPGASLCCPCLCRGGRSLLLRVKGPGKTVSLICAAHPKTGAAFAGSQAPASFHSPWVSLGIHTQGTRVASP